VPAALWQLSATELAARLRAGELTATEVLGSFLERIAEVNPRINAIVSLDEESAWAQAAALDRLGPQEGHVLHGLPLAIKDLEDTAGLRTTYGSPLYADHYPAADSLMVSRLRTAGAVIIGKTNTPEWGAGSQTFNPVFGATRNPWDLARTPGGSSGGAAAAVASGMLPLADGSDFGGSIRNPASLCGLVGLRPSPGRVPDPTGDPYNPLPVLGPIARTAADAALMLSAIAGPDPRVPMSSAWPPLMGGDPGQTPSPAGLKVAWCPDLGDLPVAPEVRAVLDHGRGALEQIGCDVEDVSVTLPGADEAFEVLRGVGFAANFGPLISRHRDQFKDTIVQNTEYGLALTGGQIGEAIAARVATAQRMRRLLEDHDVIALTSVQVAAFDVETEWPTEIDGNPMGSYLEWMRSCSRITVTGHPSISVPAGVTAGGLPVGMQLVGPEGDERGLLRLAAALDRATGYSTLRPPL
jgi:amidase